MTDFGIISQATKNGIHTMQVVIIADTALTFPSGRKQVRKMSYTRHLQQVDGKWQGHGLNKVGVFKDAKYPIVDYTDDVKKAIKAAQS